MAAQLRDPEAIINFRVCMRVEGVEIERGGKAICTIRKRLPAVTQKLGMNLDGTSGKMLKRRDL